MVRSHIPKRGDVYLVDLNPVVGYECVVHNATRNQAVSTLPDCPDYTGWVFSPKGGVCRKHIRPQDDRRGAVQ